jgi:hypothetical protein
MAFVVGLFFGIIFGRILAGFGSAAGNYIFNSRFVKKKEEPKYIVVQNDK